MNYTILKTCPKCNVDFNAYSKWGERTFCSPKCRNSRGPRTDECKQKIREKLTGRKSARPSPQKGKILVERIQRDCPVCQHQFTTTKTRNKVYCSSDCRKKRAGGYRPGSGRSKSGYYKGIYCGSTYELCWVIYNLDHSIPFTRFTGCLVHNEVKYYPDFLLEDGKTIVEIKGYEANETVDIKTGVAERHGYTVKVLRKKDLQPIFDYVSQTYTKKYHSLYDGYKPKYEFVCSYCESTFTRDKKSKYKKVYCSRRCSLLGNRVISRNNQYTHREAAGVATSPSN